MGSFGGEYMGCIALKTLVPKAEHAEVRLPGLKVATPHIKWLVNKQQSLSETSYLVGCQKRTASLLLQFEQDIFTRESGIC